MTDLPEPVAELATVLAAMPGAVAVALGGSRALGVSDAHSDWDFGLYYRGTIDLAALTAWGTVHPPGAWGRLLNGGAFLRCGAENVDVGLRDIGVVEHWTRGARARGRSRWTTCQASSPGSRRTCVAPNSATTGAGG